MNHPEAVFGRVREGAFDAKASSRNYFPSFPRLPRSGKKFFSFFRLVRQVEAWYNI